MTFREIPLRDVEALFARALGPAPNVHERSRRIVASLQIDAGREPTGLEKSEERSVWTAMEAHP